MVRRLLAVAAALLVGSCSPGTVPGTPGPFDPKVNTDLKPAQAVLPDAQGNPQPVATARDAQGVTTDFVEGLVLLRPAPGVDLNAFLSRYDGTVVSDDTIPEPPASLGITLTAEERKPTEYLVRINLAKVDLSTFIANASATGLTGVMEFSSQAGLLTLAGVADAVAAGFDASLEFISYPNQTFPLTLLNTRERPDGAGGFTDAFATTRFQTGGSQTNVTLAWQFLAAHGIQRRVRVAIVDGGFWLNPDGTPRGTDSDFPANPIQYDFVGNDYFADGAGVTPCGATNPCFWHGTGAGGVATGILNNLQGAAGTGGLVAEPMLFNTSGSRSNKNWAIRTAIAWQADVVSMSWGGDCNQACRSYDRDHTPFQDAINAGSRAVFVASAGNGDSAGNGYDVGDPRFYHPCIEDHVICVGALNNDATTKIGYSNFGDAVDIFAPTNIPVMAQPASSDSNPAGPASPVSFGGTSASTPFVAGVAAMIKAINPDLNNDQVAAILRDTAHAGAPPVTRHLDAYAAVRRAAQGIDIVKDRFEVGAGGNDLTPTNLGAIGPYSQPNLNLDGRDRDYFRFEVPGGSTLTIDLQYPQGLGRLSLLDLDSLGECGDPVLVGETDLGGTGRRFTYTVPGGSFQVGVRADDVNAYNLGIAYSSASFPADGYEPNDLPASARWIYSFSFAGSGLFTYLQIDPRITIDASLHTATDADHYIVRGAHLRPAERIVIAGQPVVRVYGNDSPVTLEVYALNADNTPGALIARVGGGSCTAQPVAVTLQEDVYYLVKVTGTAGRYTLRNGVAGGRRYIPQLVRDRVYVILHPGEPVERTLRFAENYVFVADFAFRGITTNSRRSHLRLFDFDGNLLSEAQPDTQGPGERLSLASTVTSQVYALQITPQSADAQNETLRMEWDPAPATRVSGNLILNPGAEEGEADDSNGSVEDIPQWDTPAEADIAMPTVIFYDAESGNPTPDGPGPNDRGSQFFAGGPSNSESGIRQAVSIDPAWQEAVNEGRVKYRFSAFLGGHLDEADSAGATLTFLDAHLEMLGQASLPPVTPRERANQTGLLPVQTSDYLPEGTSMIYVDLVFRRVDGLYNNGYADNLELVFSEYNTSP